MIRPHSVSLNNAKLKVTSFYRNIRTRYCPFGNRPWIVCCSQNFDTFLLNFSLNSSYLLLSLFRSSHKILQVTWKFHSNCLLACLSITMITKSFLMHVSLNYFLKILKNLNSCINVIEAYSPQ